MMDSASLAIWATDLVLLALAYIVGRIHGGIILREFYLRKLAGMIEEVKLMRVEVKRINELYLQQKEK